MQEDDIPDCKKATKENIFLCSFFKSIHSNNSSFTKHANPANKISIVHSEKAQLDFKLKKIVQKTLEQSARYTITEN